MYLTEEKFEKIYMICMKVLILISIALLAASVVTALTLSFNYTPYYDFLLKNVVETAAYIFAIGLCTGIAGNICKHNILNK